MRWESRVGRRFRDRVPFGAVAALVGSGIVAADLLLSRRGSGYLEERGLLALAAPLALLALARGDRRTVGLRLRPRPDVGWWIRTVAVVDGAFAGLVIVLFLALLACGVEATEPTFGEPGDWLMHACVLAPLVEESVYRIALCAPLAPWIGRWPTIAVSTIVFAALHVVYGTPGPDNLLAGGLLAWAYLRSDSVVVPIVLHAAGNALVYGFWAVAGPMLA